MKTEVLPEKVPPHVHRSQTSLQTIRVCLLTLLPAAVWSVLLFGWPAAQVWLISILAAAVTEVAANYALTRRFKLHESAILTGCLIALAMPPEVPWYVPAMATVFALAVVKHFFGGTGANWMNPAMAGVAFAFLNWPAFMLVNLNQLGLTSSGFATRATPFLQNILANSSVVASAGGLSVSSIDRLVTGVLNDGLFNLLNAKLPEGYIDSLLGFNAASIGGSGTLFIIIGSIIMIARRSVKLEIPLAMLLVYGLLMRLIGAGLVDVFLLDNNILLGLTSGGLLLTGFYYATDPVTSPVRRSGMILYGLIIGGLFFVFARWKTYIEGAAFAIIIANTLVSTIDRLAMPSVFKKVGNR